jgi:hypothetical protein
MTGDQVSRVPKGGVQTGGGSTSGLQHGLLLGLGAVLMTAGAATAMWSRCAFSRSGRGSGA